MRKTHVSLETAQKGRYSSPMAIFRRKIYERLLAWKEGAQGKTALLIEGARRVGKSTIVEEFAKKEYSSHLIVDFTNAGEEVKSLFDAPRDLDYLFLRLQLAYGISFKRRDTLIVFDEVQLCPKARQAIKLLVKDGRYDYIETGSLLSIRKNVEGILIPSEERKIEMRPMDFEEFLWAIGEEGTVSLLREAYEKRIPLGQAAHREMMRKFRLYMLVGGMPQAVEAYLEENDLSKVDETKRDILRLYEEDFGKIDQRGRLSALFLSIPGQLAANRTFFRRKRAAGGAGRLEEILPGLLESKTVLAKRHADDPGPGMSRTASLHRFKLYLLDTGLYVTECFRDKDFVENIIYGNLLSDKLPANLGYLYENVVAQTFAASGKGLFYHAFYDEEANRYYEIDFLLPEGDKVSPIEIKGAAWRAHRSLDLFREKYPSRYVRPRIIHTKDRGREGEIDLIPVYMAMFL